MGLRLDALKGSRQMEQDMFVLENEYRESLKREKVEKEMESIFWN
jgi:hypothetical protein